MDEQEAKAELERELAVWRRRTYGGLAVLIGGEPETREVTGPSGVKYQIEMQVFWDAKPDGNVRVVGSIDEGGINAFLPLTEGFIMAPDGKFIGE